MPETTQNPDWIEPLAKSAQQALGGQLVSLILYGSVARGTAGPQTNDVNLLVVLAASDSKILARLREAIAPFAQHHVTPYIILESELPQLADLFATRLLEMKRGYKVISGRDILADLNINDQILRIRISQELLNIAIRLRGELFRAASPDALAQDLDDYLQPFLKTLRSLIYTAAREHIESRKELIERASDLYDLDREALLQLSAWRSGKVTFVNDQWIIAASSLLENVQRVIEKLHA